MNRDALEKAIKVVAFVALAFVIGLVASRFDAALSFFRQ